MDVNMFHDVSCFMLLLRLMNVPETLAWHKREFSSVRSSPWPWHKRRDHGRQPRHWLRSCQRVSLSRVQRHNRYTLGGYFSLWLQKAALTHLSSSGCRNPSSCREDLEKAIKSDERLREGTFECLDLDLTSLDSVRSFATNILARTASVDVLVNNGGGSVKK